MHKQGIKYKQALENKYNFRIKTMFGSSLPPVVCRMFVSYLSYLCLFAYSGVQHIFYYVFALLFISIFACTKTDEKSKCV